MLANVLRKFLGVFGLGLCSACSNALDERQIVSSSTLGTVFFADVISVYFARTDAGALPVGYRSVPETFYNERAAEFDIPFERSLRLRVLGSFVGVLTGDLETRFASLRCLYVVNTDDEAAIKFVRGSVLGEFDDPFADPFDESYEESFDDFEVFDAPQSSEEFFDGDDEGVIATEFFDDETSLTRNVLTLAQSCDRQIAPGTEVLVTLNTDGATIQSITPEIRAFFGLDGL